MNNKCKWIDGEFRACKGFEEGSNDLRNVNLIRPVKINFCPFCGEPLKKPEKKELIPDRIPLRIDLDDNKQSILNIFASISAMEARIDYILKRLDK